MMCEPYRLRVALVGLIIAGVGASMGGAQMDIEKPQPTVPEIYTIKGAFARIAYNNEGWVTLGYRAANASQGTDWMLLEVGVTVFKGVSNQTLERASFAVKMPDGSMVPMASQRQFAEAGYLRALNQRASLVRDSINYFPTAGGDPCPMLFFSDPADDIGTVAFDRFDISWQRNCFGRLFFKLPEGQTIEPGQYWLEVQFAGSTVEVPFRIMTKEEEKFLKKNWKNLKKEHEAYLKRQAEKARQSQE
jgi:hypothetical protein